MRELLVGLGAAIASVIGTVAVLWKGRRQGPDALDSLMGRQNDFTDRLSARVDKLEAELEQVRKENRELSDREHAARLENLELRTKIAQLEQRVTNVEAPTTP